MPDSVDIKLAWLSLPAVLLSNSNVLSENAAFNSLTAETQTSLLQQLRLIISNSDICHTRHKSILINVSPQLRYAVDIMLQPNTSLSSVYTAIFYPQQQPSGITELYASVFEHSGEAIMITDAEDDIVAVNQSFVEITGFAAQDIMYRKPDFLRLGLNEEATLQLAWQSVHKQGHWSGEIKTRKADGQYYVCWLSLSAVYDENKRVSHYVSIFSDITNHVSEYKKYKKMAYYDFLTGLPNRALLEDRFEQFTLHNQRLCTTEKCAVIFIDINKFKEINDTYGHQIGDECLIAVAKILKKSIRADDTACRFSGDEFVLLLTQIQEITDPDGIIEKIKSNLSNLHTQIKIDNPITLSIGTSFFPDEGSDLETLISIADKKMYQEKKRG